MAQDYVKQGKYHIAMRVFHWVMAFIIFGMVFLGWFMASLDKEVPYKFSLYGWHKSFGVLILLLVCFRVATRLLTVIPQLDPKKFSKSIIILAKLGHLALYGLMVAVPSVAIIGSQQYGYPVAVFGLELPNMFEKNPEMAKELYEFHEFFAYTLLVVAILHGLFALKHRYFDKKDIMHKMF